MLRILMVFLVGFATSSHAVVNIMQGTMSVPCGTNPVSISYQVSVKNGSEHTNKFAILIDGSPLTKFFSDNSNNYVKISQGLWQSGYKIFEFKYVEKGLDVDGFYAACFRQGLPNIMNHAAAIYDNAVNILKYDSKNKNHRLVALGNSIGAVLLQNMAFSKNKHFDNIALIGVLLGDAERGCQQGLKYLETLEGARESGGVENVFRDRELLSGMSWASFMSLVQNISTSGEGCCLENSSGFGACKPSVKNEYTSELNFERQPYFAQSNLAMFEGQLTYPRHGTATKFLAANPAQVQYIAEHRLRAGALTQTFFYEHCDHSVINCAGSQGLHDILGFLTARFPTH